MNEHQESGFHVRGNDMWTMRCTGGHYIPGKVRDHDGETWVSIEPCRLCGEKLQSGAVAWWFSTNEHESTHTWSGLTI